MRRLREQVNPLVLDTRLMAFAVREVPGVMTMMPHVALDSGA